MRALPLCSLLLLPLSACDEAAFDLVETADRPSAIPDPPGASVLESCALYCADYLSVCGSDQFSYGSVSECETLCGYWEAEEDSACRVGILDDINARAVESFEIACADAGPDSEACGSGYVVTCDRYCDELRSTCNEDGTYEASFESRGKCLSWCEGEPLPGDHDSIECRLGALESVAAPPDCETAAPDASCK